MILIKGQISTKVEKVLAISAEINMTENGSQLDSSKSKFIIGSNCLEVKPMKKENQSYHFKWKQLHFWSGTYFVRCITFNSNGWSNEIMSNSVTTSGNYATFDYGETPIQITNLKSGMQKEAIQLAKVKKIEKINLQFKKVWAVIHYEFWT